MNKSPMVQAAKRLDDSEKREEINQSRIHALELQVQTLTAAVQHLMLVTKPLIELVHQAQQATPNIILGR